VQPPPVRSSGRKSKCRAHRWPARAPGAKPVEEVEEAPVVTSPRPCRHRVLPCNCCAPGVACCWWSYPPAKRSRAAIRPICCSRTCCAPPACRTPADHRRAGALAAAGARHHGSGPGSGARLRPGFVSARLEDAPCACLWLIGLPAVRFAGEADAEAFNSELQVEGLGWPGPCRAWNC
jgi:hypothetical protein